MSTQSISSNNKQLLPNHSVDNVIALDSIANCWCYLLDMVKVNLRDISHRRPAYSYGHGLRDAKLEIAVHKPFGEGYWPLVTSSGLDGICQYSVKFIAVFPTILFVWIYLWFPCHPFHFFSCTSLNFFLHVCWPFPLLPSFSSYTYTFRTQTSFNLAVYLAVLFYQ